MAVSCFVCTVQESRLTAMFCSTDSLCRSPADQIQGIRHCKMSAINDLNACMQHIDWQKTMMVYSTVTTKSATMVQ